VPVGWAIDPVIGEQFPALWDYFARTASANDSFVGGVGGGGYVFLNTLSGPAFSRYARRVGRLLEAHGPSVVDTCKLPTIASTCLPGGTCLLGAPFE
jgi:hypothetical protein